MKSYGITKIEKQLSTEDLIVEEIKRRGYSLIEDFESEVNCDQISESLEAIYEQQENEVGKDFLMNLNELNVCRSPFMYELQLTNVFSKSSLVKLCQRILEGPVILHLQNGIINRPSSDHHQTSWHRDLPYQEFTSSSPLALNAFLCLSEFTEENGGTILIPYSQHFPNMPSEEYSNTNSVILKAKKGTLVIFDSFIFHRAGVNRSNNVRYGLNHVFTRPFIKQQLNYSEIDMTGMDYQTKNLLGQNFRVLDSVKNYRLEKNKRNG